MSASDEAVVDGLRAAPGGDLDGVTLDPDLSELETGDAGHNAFTPADLRV